VTGIDGREFVVIGENVHATRVLLLRGPQIGTDDDGREGIVFTDVEGAVRHLPIPESEKALQPYLEAV
jgi:hypothetical protein